VNQREPLTFPFSVKGDGEDNDNDETRTDKKRMKEICTEDSVVGKKGQLSIHSQSRLMTQTIGKRKVNREEKWQDEGLTVCPSDRVCLPTKSTTIELRGFFSTCFTSFSSDEEEDEDEEEEEEDLKDEELSESSRPPV
jgi:hypothetical protein